MNRFRSIVLTAVTGLALVACGPAASSGEPSSGESQAAASQAQSSGGGSEASFSQGLVADLEALIPDTVGDLTIDKSSMRGNEFLVDENADPATVEFLEDLGVSPSDVSMAVGFGFSSDASSSLIMFVFRASGAETSRLVSAFKASLDSQRDAPLTWTSDEVGGKSVEKATDGETTIYLYARNDVLIFVSGDADSTEEALSGLP